MKQGVSCQVCLNQRNPADIQPRPSKLLRQVTLLICNACQQKGYEPRHLIILVGRQKGYKTVLDFIKNHQYVGDPITAKEILKDKSAF